jgi:hypothetical protein
MNLDIDELKSDIQELLDLTVEEHATGTVNREADKLWSKIDGTLNKLKELL